MPYAHPLTRLVYHKRARYSIVFFIKGSTMIKTKIATSILNKVTTDICITFPNVWNFSIPHAS